VSLFTTFERDYLSALAIFLSTQLAREQSPSASSKASPNSTAALLKSASGLDGLEPPPKPLILIGYTWPELVPAAHRAGRLMAVRSGVEILTGRQGVADIAQGCAHR